MVEIPINEVRKANAENEVDFDESKQRLDRNHSWPACIFMVFCVATCITVDILQYSMPLAFLPSVLEDRGHRAMEIATVIGVYYWTGFTGGLVITIYQIWLVLSTREDTQSEGNEHVTSVGYVRKQLQYLIYSLGVGAATLIWQALYPYCWIHTVCRFIQGAAGAVIFFYAFLLSASMFEGRQQVFAMTFTSTALNIAEVLGSSVGAVLFEQYGQRTVFWVLGLISVINQVLVLSVIASVKGTDQRVAEVASTPWPDHTPITQRINMKGWGKLKRALTRTRTICSVVLIAFAGMVKASMEEVLPIHADHRWGLNPMEIGNLFSVVAVAYISSAMLAGEAWLCLGKYRVAFSAMWLFLLGLVAWCVVLTASVYKSEAFLVFNLIVYGIALGFTQTPAALLLAEVVEVEQGRTKDSVNGVWNTLWEAGGSLGFLFGGLLAEDYSGQVFLFSVYALSGALVAACILSFTAAVNFFTLLPQAADEGQDAISKVCEAAGNYGSVSEKQVARVRW